MKDKIFVDSLDSAYKDGYFSGSINRHVLIEAIVRSNDDVKVRYNKDSAGLHDVRNGFICGISRLFSIPQFTLIEKSTNKVLCRSWKKIIEIIRREGYEINEKYLY